MRLIVTCCVLLASAPMVAIASPSQAPASAANLLRLRPGPWRLPATAYAGIRFEPEAGEVGADPALRAPAPSRSLEEVAARARAAASVVRRADGSGHAVLGSAFRHWTVVTVDGSGGVSQDCVSSEAEARARVDAAARKQVRK